MEREQSSNVLSGSSTCSSLTKATADVAEKDYENAVYLENNLETLKLSNRINSIFENHKSQIRLFKEEQLRSKNYVKWGPPIIPRVSSAKSRVVEAKDDIPVKTEETEDVGESDVNNLKTEQSEENVLITPSVNNSEELITSTSEIIYVKDEDSEEISDHCRKRHNTKEESHPSPGWIDTSNKKLKLSTDSKSNVESKNDPVKGAKGKKFKFKKVEKQPCPICNGLFFQTEIAQHASNCESYS